MTEERDKLCVMCGKGPPYRPWLNQCLGCIMVVRQKKVDNRKAAGVCLQCGKRPPAPGVNSCRPCLDAGKHYYRRSVKSARKKQRDMALMLLFPDGTPVCCCEGCGVDSLDEMEIDHIDNDPGADYVLYGDFVRRIHKRPRLSALQATNLILAMAEAGVDPRYRFRALCSVCNQSRRRNGGKECRLEGMLHSRNSGEPGVFRVAMASGQSEVISGERAMDSREKSSSSAI